MLLARRRRATTVLLSLGHAIDHFVLLIFASAVGAIAADFAMDWEQLMPYATGAFLLFGIGAALAGRLGDLWGRRAMMLVFFFGIGAATIAVAMAQAPWQLAAALTIMGAFSAIYHPVGIPMLVENAPDPGWRIGINGLAGNLGIAAAAAVTGMLVTWSGWRMAFIVPGLLALAAGTVFAAVAPREHQPPAKRLAQTLPLPKADALRVFGLLTGVAICSALIFNFTTNGNGQLLAERMDVVASDPAKSGLLLAVVYAIASLAQPVVGRLIDRLPLKRLYFAVVIALPAVFLASTAATGWWFYLLLIAQMVLIFGQIPFIDAVSVRYFDDRIRSRIAGLRFTIAFGISALAVAGLGPLVRSAGFHALFLLLATIAAMTVVLVLTMPDVEDAKRLPAAAAAE